MAAQAPAEVAAAFSEMDDAGNLSVRGDLIAAASQMPAAAAVSLLAKIVGFPTRGFAATSIQMPWAAC